MGLVCDLRLVFLGATASWELIAGADLRNPRQYSQTIAVGVFVTAYFGLGLQYFQLRLARSGSAVMTVFLFFVWLLPVLLGSISFSAWGNRSFYGAILCLSPLTGIAMSSGVIENSISKEDYLKLYALLPAITFAGVFLYLRIAIQRKIDLTIRSSVQAKVRQPDPFDELLGPVASAKSS